LVLGAATAGLGLLVIFGWLVGNRTLIQVMPTFVPMQFNTALGFVLSGGALLLLAVGRQQGATIAGGLAFALGTLTLFQYATGVNLGIDELFMKHDITTKTSNPGRMAPNSAVCFALVGLASAVRGSPWTKVRPSLMRVVPASIAFGLAVVALSGYVTGLETAYGWGNLTRMAVHTSVGFLLVANGLLALVWSYELEEDTWMPNWLPVPTGVGIMTATLCFWQALSAQSATIQQETGLTTLSDLAVVMLLVGTLLAIAVALVAHLALQSNRRAGQVERMNLNLERLVDERTQEADRARQEAIEANRAKSRFLANMSHELRTPMNAIIGYSEMLIEDAEDEDRSEEAEDLRKIHGAGTHLLELINGVLDLSKIEAGKMELFLETFEIEPFIAGIVSTVQPLVRKNKNELQVEVDSGLGSMHADVTKLRQCIFNLLSNAAKFTQAGTIVLHAAPETRGDESWVRFEVRDSGVGIPAHKVDAVFDEFSQADDSTTRNYGGTGLGLPISKRFCKMMGGEIAARSTVGEGSTFAVHLPLHVRETGLPSVEQRRADARAASDEGQRIGLVIDDEAGARELIRRALEKDGFHVTCAADGDEGLSLARDIRPAAITLDIMMPGRDGWDVLADLKSDEDLADVPVVMISVLDDEGTAYSLGATDFVRKPIDRRKLSEVLAAATEKREAVLEKRTGSPEELLDVLRELS
jgi:signal transduction histidine kinase/CheY-like chemotaxis protein